jgi:hypothetical protein
MTTELTKSRPVSQRFLIPGLPCGQTRLAGQNLQDQRGVQYKKLATEIFTL